jgi:hypothetical protein
MKIMKLLHVSLLLLEILVMLGLTIFIVIGCIRLLRRAIDLNRFNWKVAVRVWLVFAGMDALLTNFDPLPKSLLWLACAFFLLNLPGLFIALVMMAFWEALVNAGFISPDSDNDTLILIVAEVGSALFWATLAGYFFRLKIAQPPVLKSISAGGET